MKAKQITSLALASLLLLSGCSSNKTIDGKSVVASTTSGNVFADDLYTQLAATTSGKSALFSYVLDQLINKICPVTSDMKENANEMISSIESSYQSQYGDEYETQLESDLASQGMTTLDDYKEQVIYSLQYAELIKIYVKDHFDDVFEDYYALSSPRIVSLIKVSMTDVENPTDEEKEKLNEIEKLLKTDKSFGDIAKEYSDDSDTAGAKGNLGVVDSTSTVGDTYGEDVLTKALALKNGEVSSSIKGTDGYYFLCCTSTAKADVKKEVTTVDINSPLLTYDDYIIYEVFNTYKINYESDDIKEAIESVVNDALKSRAELRGN